MKNVDYAMLHNCHLVSDFRVCQVTHVDRLTNNCLFLLQLTYDYKFDFEDDQHKIPCLCGAQNCRKWMN